MKIYGIGTDITEMARIELLWQKYGWRFARHILSALELDELAKTKLPVQFLAKRFAAKEAVAKALGTGFRENVYFNQIQLINNSLGKPEVIFLAATKDFVQSLGSVVCHISIADEKQHAIAFAILEC